MSTIQTVIRIDDPNVIMIDRHSVTMIDCHSVIMVDVIVVGIFSFLLIE